MEAILTARFEEEPEEAYFFELSGVPSPWKIYWTDAVREGGGLHIQDPLFGQHWSKHSG